MLDRSLVTRAIVEMEEEVLLEMLNNFVLTNPSEKEVNEIVEACQKGMEYVGDLFYGGEYFIGDLIFAGELLQESIEILSLVRRPSSYLKSGKILLGTVQGDLHDIGKNIFKNMAGADGFEVFDLGRDKPVEDFVNNVKLINPDIVALAGVMSYSLDTMKETVDAIVAAGIRDSVKIIIGGYPVTKKACEYIGADDFAKSAAEGVKIAHAWMSELIKKLGGKEVSK